jgi:quinol monooxygenase YgiN
MSFVQTIEIETTDDQAVRDHLAAWDREQAGIAPGYQGCRLLANQDAPGRFLIIVDFSSPEEAEQNNQRPETAAWADKLRGLVTGEPTYRNFRPTYSTAKEA